MPLPRRPVLALLCAGLLAGCGLFGRSEVTSAASAHAVFLALGGCPTFVAKTAGAGFAVATAEGGYAPATGDLLVGGLRSGPLDLLLFRSGSDEPEGEVRVEVRTYDRSLDAVQDFWRRHCAVPPPQDPVFTRIEPRRPLPGDTLVGPLSDPSAPRLGLPDSLR